MVNNLFHQNIYVKYMQFLYIKYTSIKLKKGKQSIPRE